MGGAAGFFLELMLFIVSEHDLEVRPRKSPSSCLLSTIFQVLGSKSTVSLVSHKSHNNCVHNPKSKL